MRLNGRTLDHNALVREAAFMPSDRHSEGLASSLTVRENATFAALEKFATYGILSRKQEVDAGLDSTFKSLAVKAAGHGGADSVAVGRQSAEGRDGARPAVGAGPDRGRRTDAGRRRRAPARKSTASCARSRARARPVIVNSSDAAELEGLCDKVIVLSRGRVVETLSGDDVNEARIVAAAVGAATHIGDSGAADRRNAVSGWRHFLQSDNAPAVPLTLVTVLLGLYIFSQNANFLSSFNVANILLAATALGFIALGQTVALLVGGHRSVGRSARGISRRGRLVLRQRRQVGR